MYEKVQKEIPVGEKGQRILYKDEYGFWHEFIIRGVEEIRDHSGYYKELFCESSFYELLGDYIDDKRPSGKASSALAIALEPTRWEVGRVDDLGSSRTNFYHISAKEAVQKVAEAWGGDIRTRIEVSGNKITHRYIDLLSLRGHDLKKRFTYTKDLLEVTREILRDDVVTALYGYGRGEEVGDGFGRRIDFKDINNGKAYVENNEARLIWGRNNPDGSKAHVFSKIDYDDIEDPEILIELAREDLARLSSPEITYTTKVINLKALGIDHEGVDLGTTAIVIDKEFIPELRLSSRVISIKRDLLDPYNTEIVLGNFADNIVDELNKQEEYINNFRDKQGVWDRSNIIGPDGSIDANYVDGIVDELNKKINESGGYVYVSDDGEGIITYNKPYDQNPTQAIQIRGGSFRIANSKKPDGSWNWRTFGDGSGFTADQIITGILKGGKVHFDLENGTFLIGEDSENYFMWFDGETLRISYGDRTLEEVIDSKADTIVTDEIEDSLNEWKTISASQDDVDYLRDALEEYRELLDNESERISLAGEDISDLLNRVPLIENNMGEFVEKWKFLETTIIAGEEGLLIGNLDTNTGVRVGTDRIDFIDKGEVVAYISNQTLYIERGIFVKSLQVGEHKEETIAGGHTITSWVGEE